MINQTGTERKVKLDNGNLVTGDVIETSVSAQTVVKTPSENKKVLYRQARNPLADPHRK